MSPRKSSVTPENAPADASHRRAWINYQLSVRGLSIASLAKKKGVSRQTVWKAISSPYPKMEKVIANALRMKPQHIWPERYGKDAA